MKKIVAIVVVALLVLVGVGPWFMGRVAHSRVDKGLDSLTEKLPYIKVVDRKWSQGWFHSESNVTFEFVLPGIGNKPVAALADAMPAGEPVEVPAEEGTADEAADEAVEAPAPQAIPRFPTIPPLRFSIRSDVLHGPVLGLSGVGLARMDTKLVLSEEIKAKMREVLGTDEPVRISTRLAFLGGGTTTFSGDARTIPMARLDPSDPDGSLAWDAFSLSIGSGPEGKSYDFKGSQPRIEVKSGRNGDSVLFGNLSLEGKGSRVTEDLYDGDVTFAAGRMSVVTKASPPVDVSDLKYTFISKSRGDFFDYSMRMGTGEIKTPQLDALKFGLKEVHYDLTLRHLHTPTLQKLMHAVRDSYSNVLANPAVGQMAMLAPLAEHGRELLKHDPEFVLDRVGVVTADGEAVFKGVIKLQGVTDADLEAGAMTLVPKIVADITFEAPQKLFENVPNGNMVMGLGIDQGYVKREGGKITSHIEFKGGKLTVNGKSPQLPPMFGGAAPTPAPEEQPLPVPPAGG